MFGTCGLYHSHFVASDGWVTTTEVDQVIIFPRQLNTLEIIAELTDLEIKFNNDDSIFEVAAGIKDGITNLPINRIIVVGAAGQKLKWRGLTSINET